MFARWDSEQDCLAEMLCLHEEEDAALIVAQIAARVNSGTLFKSGDHPMQIISKDDSEDLVVYGPCTWELRDPEGDVVTTAGQVDFFTKWFTQVPESYRCVMLDHGNFKVGEPLLSYEGKDGKYLTHVHEKGAMLITKVRPEDGLKATSKFREDVLLGVYKSYSISWWPRKFEMVEEEKGRTYYHTELDPVEVTICRFGMNEMAKFGIVKRYNPENIEAIMTRLEVLENIAKTDITTAPESLVTTVFPPSVFNRVMNFIIRGKNVMTKEELTVEEIEQIIEALKTERESIREAIDEYYEGFPDTPDWIQDAYDRLDDIWQELSAWKEARISLLTGVGKAIDEKDDPLGVLTLAQKALQEITERTDKLNKLQVEPVQHTSYTDPSIPSESVILKINTDAQKAIMEVTERLKALGVNTGLSYSDVPDDSEAVIHRIDTLAKEALQEVTAMMKELEATPEEKRPPAVVKWPALVIPEEETEEVDGLDITLRVLAHKAFKDAFTGFV